MSKISIQNFSNQKILKFSFAMILWVVLGTAFYFGFLEIELEHNLEMSLVMAAALSLLILHLIKILKQAATHNL